MLFVVLLQQLTKFCVRILFITTVYAAASLTYNVISIKCVVRMQSIPLTNLIPKTLNKILVIDKVCIIVVFRQIVFPSVESA